MREKKIDDGQMAMYICASREQAKPIIPHSNTENIARANVKCVY